MNGVATKVRERWLSARPFGQLHAWVDLLLRADESGSMLCTQKELAAEWGWSYAAVRRFLDACQADNLLRKIRHGKRLEISMSTRLNQQIGEHSCAQLNEHLVAQSSERVKVPRSSSDLLASVLRRDPLEGVDFAALLASGGSLSIHHANDGATVTVTGVNSSQDSAGLSTRSQSLDATGIARVKERPTDTGRRTEASHGTDHGQESTEDRIAGDACSIKGLPRHHERVREYARLLRNRVNFHDRSPRHAMGLHQNVANNAAFAVCDADCELAEGDIADLLEWSIETARKQAKLVRQCFTGGLKKKFTDIGRAYEGGSAAPRTSSHQERETTEARRTRILEELAAMEERA